MPDVRLVVDGTEYAGWKTARVTRSIEAVACGFELTLTERWTGHEQLFPIAPEAKCRLLLVSDLKRTTLVTGYVDRCARSYSATDHAVSVSGRDRTGDLVDCSALLKDWEFLGIDLLKFAKLLAEPFGVSVALQKGLNPPALPARVSVDPGETAFDALARACRMCGVLSVSDGTGSLLLTRAGAARAATALIEGKNLLAASAERDETNRFRRYVVMGQNPTAEVEYSDAVYGDAGAGMVERQHAGIRGEATDPNVRRSERARLVLAESACTIATAKTRAEWEAKFRAARAELLKVTVQGWTQGDGSLWPVNALVAFTSPTLGFPKARTLLITGATHTLDQQGGTRTELQLMRPDAFLPEPQVAPGLWPELAKRV